MRSINGTVGSAASCKTRSLKYNQLISRFIIGRCLISMLETGFFSHVYKSAYLIVNLILTHWNSYVF